MKTYKEARDYIEKTMNLGSVLGLDNMKQLLERMGNPQNKLSFIHVAGTNGKGSIVVYLSEILKEAGYQTGKYVSPTLLGYRERIQVNSVWIEKEELAEGVELIEKRIQEMTGEGFSHPTAFEIETALAFWYFEKKKCDIVVLETGMGGRLDATNIIPEALCYVFSSISMDHMDYLGNTLEEITRNKAGIIKSNGIVVVGKQEPSVLALLRKTAKEKGCNFTLAAQEKISEIKREENGQSFFYETLNWGKILIRIPLLGVYQIENAAIALEAIDVLQKLSYQITRENIQSGIKKSKWFGRFSKVSEKPLFFVDGAHNENAAKNLRKTLETYFPNKKFIYIVGVFKDKDYSGILEHTVDLAKKIYTITAPGSRGLEAVELKGIVEKYHKDVQETQSIQEAIEKSRREAAKDDIIVAFGSLSYLGEVYEYFKDS